MRKAKVLFKNEEAGILTQHDDGSFSFRYHDDW
jgi:HipA-like protein